MLFEARAFAGATLLADGLADARQLRSHLLVGSNDVVEGIRDLSRDAGPGHGQADREVAFAHGLQACQDQGQIIGCRGTGVDVPVAVLSRPVPVLS